MANEKSFLVGIKLQSEDLQEAQSSFEELTQLAYTAGASIFGHAFQNIKKIDPKYFIGFGKAQEISEEIKMNPVDLVIIDHDISPSQQNHLEELLGVKVLDRTGLILDIFAKRAKSREGKLQVELAQLSYLYPRLRGHGVLMSRLGGGIGTRGPGEMKLEVDRRKIRDRITYLKREIFSLKETRTMHRQKRQKVPIPIVAIVGYTNAGKSTLLNQLTHASVLAEDKLFATLDPTTRHLYLPGHQKILVTDTVGFIKRLPVQLVDAFKATLEEVVEADLLLHVIDLSHPDFEKQQEEVRSILDSLEVSRKPTLHVYNKIDKVSNLRTLFLKHERLHPFVTISAIQKENFDSLLEKISSFLSGFVTLIDIRIPIEDQKVLSQIHADGKVFDLKYYRWSIRVKAQVSQKMAEQLKKKYS